MGPTDPNRLRDFVIRLLLILVILVIPFQVLRGGYMPADDALRHIGKVFAGREWPDIVLMREGATQGFYYDGWDTILGLIHRVTGASAEDLVTFSVVFLFCVFALVPCFLVSQPEWWLAALAWLSFLLEVNTARLFFGRPYIVSMAAMLWIGLTMDTDEEGRFPWPRTLLLTGGLFLASWIHSSWYFFLILLWGPLLLGRWRTAGWLGLMIFAGAFGAGLACGDPVGYFRETFEFSFGVLFGKVTQPAKVRELLVFFPGDFFIWSVLAMALLQRSSPGEWLGKKMGDPLFLNMTTCWALQLFKGRIWPDLGAPLACAWMYRELTARWPQGPNLPGSRRVAFLALLILICTLSFTADFRNRYDRAEDMQGFALNGATNPRLFPEPGGLVFNDSLQAFFYMFFLNPTAPWKYVLSFEITMMPVEDQRIYARIMATDHEIPEYEPWVRRMKPADRMIVRTPTKPGIPGLIWEPINSTWWSGRQVP